MRKIPLGLLFLPGVVLAAPLKVDGSIAAGALVGRIAYDGPQADGSGHLHLGDTVVGEALTLGGSVGSEIAEGVALGLGLDATYQNGLRGRLGFTSYDSAVELDATADLTVTRRGVVWRAGAGISAALWNASQAAIAAPDNVASLDMVRGPVAKVSVSWPFAAHVGVACEARSAYLVRNDLSYMATTAVLALSFR